MNDTVKEWIDKAERDLATARRELAESADREEAAQALDIASRLRGKLLLLLQES
ncbi:MAG: hypothetical protein ABSA04_01480 [Desulfobaccales bacterium]|jgi:HEPN domain-containing protein